MAHATRTSQAPVVDGRLDEAAWSGAVVTDAFVQHYPAGGAAPGEHTTMRVLYDDDALYFGFDCEQVRSPILEHLTRRDRDSESEWVGVRIDPKNEGKVAFAFAVNSIGVLVDALITEPSSYNFDWDENWEAVAARTPRGWSAELRIPFRVLRFDPRDAPAGWSLQASRYIAQRQEVEMWPLLPRDAANPLAHFGRLDNLSGIKAGGALELRPFAAGRVERVDATDQTLASGTGARAAAGLDLKWHVAQDLTLDAAVLPDFAQVEADQVILNLTNYETFLPEKRPLFLEGADVFSFPLQIFYSRRIGIAPTVPTLRSDAAMGMAEKLVNLPEPAPIYGATKIVGRVARNWTVGALAAVTGRNEVAVDTAGVRTRRLVAPAAAQNALRLKREWAGVGHVGLMATGVTTFEGATEYPTMPGPTPGTTVELCPSGEQPAAGTHCFRDSYVAGVDGLWRSPSGDYVVNGAFIESLVRNGAAARQLDGTVIAPGAHAPGGWLRVAKEGGPHLLASASYSGAGRTLDYNDLGFMPRQNLHELHASVGYRTLDPGRFTLETSSALELTERRSLAGLDLGQVASLTTRVRLQGFWSVFAAADVAPSRFDDREVGSPLVPGVALERGGYVGGRVDIGTDPKRVVIVGLSSQAQMIEGDARMVSAQGIVTLLPHAQLELSLAPQLVWSTGEYRYAGTNGADLLFGKLAATSAGAILRASFTFAPRLSLQAYAQAFLAAGRFTDLRQLTAVAGQRVRTDALAAAPPAAMQALTSPDFEQAALNVNVVLRWEYRLGSTLFLVYSRSQMPDLAAPMAPAMLQPSALGRRQAADVILLKLSYWWAS